MESAMPRSDAAAASRCAAGPPAWIILDTEALTDDDTQNATTATARTRSGQPIQVTLVAADPPRVSYFCVHCPCPKQDEDDGHHSSDAPSVIYADGDLALLRVNCDDYFIYRAGRRPSLRLLPATFSDAEIVRQARLGLVPIGGRDGEHFFVAALINSRYEPAYELHVFRSQRGTWTKTQLDLKCYGYVEVTKVIALGDGELGWVDLRQCILACNVLSDDDPKHRFIPLPNLLPCNQADKAPRRDHRSYRDVVACADGSIKCVEMELVLQRPDISSADVLYDADLLRDRFGDRPPCTYQCLGWRIITWNRTASSDCWQKGVLFHVNDISADDALLRQIFGGDDGGQSLTVARLAAEVPTLSLDGGDVVYIGCRSNYYGTNTWMVAVDTGKKTLEEAALVISGLEESKDYISPAGFRPRKPFKSSYTSCALSKYLTAD